jgi:hypothetical protein
VRLLRGGRTDRVLEIRFGGGVGNRRQIIGSRLMIA